MAANQTPELPPTTAPTAQTPAAPADAARQLRAAIQRAEERHLAAQAEALAEREVGHLRREAFLAGYLGGLLLAAAIHGVELPAAGDEPG